MGDSFEFTLHNPLTKEDWDKITDVELENTMSVTFQTPQGRQVKYIRCEVLDKVRAEITNIHLTDTDGHSGNWYREPQAIINEALQIIDRHRAESEENNAGQE